MALGDPNMKILVVDHFSTMRRIVKTLLRQSGYTNFVEADDGNQAMEALRRDNEIELIVSDRDTPNMSGLDLLRTVRGDPRFKHVPFLLIASEDAKEGLDEVNAAGASSFLVKPFTGQTLADKLTKIYASTKKPKKRAS